MGSGDVYKRQRGGRALGLDQLERAVALNRIDIDNRHLIHKLDGIAVLAHPMQYHLSDSQLKELIRTLKPEGLNGIEAMYSRHSVSQENRVRRLAQVMGLAVSGGSDFHGSNIPGIDLGVGRGNLRIPDTTFENLRKHRDRQY